MKNKEYTFRPDGRHHKITVLDGNRALYSKNIIPQEMPVSAKFVNGEMYIHGLRNKSDLVFAATRKVDYSLNKVKGAYRLEMNAYGHPATVKLFTLDRYNNKVAIEGGNFKILPKDSYSTRRS